MKPWLWIWLTLYGAWSTSAACPFSADHPLLKLRPLADKAVVRVYTNGPPGCSDTGTGFFINAAGDVLTAGHLVPEKCTDENTSIKVSLRQGAAGAGADSFDAHVIARSSMDVLLLRLEKQPDSNRQFLKIAHPPENDVTWKNRCVLVASHYVSQFDTYSSFAEIASVALIGTPGWALSGEGFNQTRSGSPVILEDGSVAAVFLSRPGDPSDREAIVQSRAYILPIAHIPKAELNFSMIAAKKGLLSPFPSQLKNGPPSPSSAVHSSFGVSITVNGYQTDAALPVYLIAKDDTGLTRAGSLAEAGMTALLTSSSLAREVVVTRQFNASPGFRFDAGTLSIHAASLNPRVTPLPTSPCAGLDSTGCYVLGTNGESLEMRFKLYPGIDGRRAWIDGELHLVQRPR